MGQMEAGGNEGHKACWETGRDVEGGRGGRTRPARRGQRDGTWGDRMEMDQGLVEEFWTRCDQEERIGTMYFLLNHPKATRTSHSNWIYCSRKYCIIYSVHFPVLT